jgi:Flp pilus assembly pilin Flp
MNHRRHLDEAGQTMAEYAVVLSVLFIAVAVTLAAFGGDIENAIQAAVSVIPH